MKIKNIAKVGAASVALLMSGCCSMNSCDFDKMHMKHHAPNYRVHFASDSAELDHHAMKVVKKAAHAADDRCVMVVGHTDASDTMRHNMRLSERRAESVKNALMDMGVCANHVSARGHGEMKDAPEHSWNAREVTISIH